MKLPHINWYNTKDQLKSDKATKFIGRGSIRSSTAAYAIAWGKLANCGEYCTKDIVFISTEGNRNHRLPPNYTEIQRAIHAGVTFITDDKWNRQRIYNIGEREVAEYLSNQKYKEITPGTWRIL